MNTYRADLHIHTVLSPCGDLEMSPRNIVNRAAEKGLDILAVTDHNHTGHARLTRKLGEKKGIWVVYGAEINTREEVHCLTFFDTEKQLSIFQRELEGNLGKIPNEIARLGHQVIVNEQEQIIDEIAYSLYQGLDWSIEEAAGLVHKLGGIFIPAHVDRITNGLYTQLGFFPETLEVDAVEISRKTSYDAALKEYPELSACTLIKNSDAHFLDDIGRAGNRYLMKNQDFYELRLAMKGEQGRKVIEL
ncbi:MAG: PHP domain-containing protein [Bacteroidales bacterium]|nr:PHP domain-containing protein [Bacteroidales bacterium]